MTEPALPALTPGQEATLAALLAADLDASAPDSHESQTSHADGATGRPDGRGHFEDYQCTEENYGRRARPGRCRQWSVRGDTRCISHGGWPGRLEWEESGREQAEAWLSAVDGARRAAFLAAFARLGQARQPAEISRVYPGNPQCGEAPPERIEITGSAPSGAVYPLLGPAPAGRDGEPPGEGGDRP